MSRVPLLFLQVVKASHRLHSSAKLVWQEDYLLDLGPEGAWCAAPALGERISLSGSTVEKIRRLFLFLELHRYRREGQRQSWYATLPPQLNVPDTGSKLTSFAEVRPYRDALDRWIGERAATITPPFFYYRDWLVEPTANGGLSPPDTAVPAHRIQRVEPTASGAAKAPSPEVPSRERGVGGRVLPLSPELRKKPPPVVEDLNSRGKSAHADGQRGGAPELISRSAQEIVERFTPPARLAGAD